MKRIPNKETSLFPSVFVFLFAFFNVSFSFSPRNWTTRLQICSCSSPPNHGWSENALIHICAHFFIYNLLTFLYIVFVSSIMVSTLSNLLNQWAHPARLSDLHQISFTISGISSFFCAMYEWPTDKIYCCPSFRDVTSWLPGMICGAYYAEIIKLIWSEVWDSSRRALFKAEIIKTQPDFNFFFRRREGGIIPRSSLFKFWIFNEKWWVLETTLTTTKRIALFFYCYI